MFIFKRGFRCCRHRCRSDSQLLPFWIYANVKQNCRVLFRSSHLRTLIFHCLFFQTGGGSCEWEVPSQQWHPCLSSQTPTLHPSGLGIREDTQGLWITLPILWFRARSHVSEVQRFRCILTSISVMKCDLALRFNLQRYLWWKMPIIIIMKCRSNSSLSGAIKELP